MYATFSQRPTLIVAPALLLLAALAVAAVLAGSSAEAAPAVEKSTYDVVWFEDQIDPTRNGFEVDGASSTVRRSPSGLGMSFHTTGLEPGHAYTAWWVLVEGETGAETMSVMYAGGHVAGGSGTATFSAHLNPGDDSGCVAVEPFDAHCFPLQNQYTATVLLVVHDHGPIQPGAVAEQIGSFEGGCLKYVSPAFGTHNYGLGDYTCFSSQISVHAPD